MWDALRGHQSRVELFRRAAQAGRLSHAYLFVGPSGIGKRFFARCLATSFLCERSSDADLAWCGECNSCRMAAAGSHPDLFEVGRPKGKNVIPISVMVGEDDRRGKEGLCYDLTLRPAVASRKVAIIDDAELMNQESSNALLKTLEEPPVRAILFLIADRAESVLPTIRSRCQQIRFSPLPDADLEALLLENGVVEDAEEAAAIAAVASGSLGTAEQLANPSVRALRDLSNEVLEQVRQQPLRAARQMQEAIEGAGSDSASQRAAAHWFLRFLGESIRTQLRTSVGEGNESTLESLGLMLDRVVETEAQLNRFMPLPLCLEVLADDLRRLQAQPV